MNRLSDYVTKCKLRTRQKTMHRQISKTLLILARMCNNLINRTIINSKLQQITIERQTKQKWTTDRPLLQIQKHFYVKHDYLGLSGLFLMTNFQQFPLFERVNQSKKTPNVSKDAVFSEPLDSLLTSQLANFRQDQKSSHTPVSNTHSFQSECVKRWSTVLI